MNPGRASRIFNIYQLIIQQNLDNDDLKIRRFKTTIRVSQKTNSLLIDYYLRRGWWGGGEGGGGGILP